MDTKKAYINAFVLTPLFNISSNTPTILAFLACEKPKHPLFLK